MITVHNHIGLCLDIKKTEYLNPIGKGGEIWVFNVANTAWDVSRINVEMLEPECPPSLLSAYQMGPSPPQQAKAEPSQ